MNGKKAHPSSSLHRTCSACNQEILEGRLFLKYLNLILCTDCSRAIWAKFDDSQWEGPVSWV